MPPRRSGGNNPPGVTLVEALLAAAVLALAAAAVILPFTAGARCSAQDARATLAVHLATGLLEEILAHPFGDPDGSETGETGRGDWDDMDDYHGYAEPSGGICAADGRVVTDPAAAQLSRRADVETVYVTGQDRGQPPTFLRITVEVRCADQPMVRLARLVYANE
jgi:hypothetical protein